jgi:hypothetical protein
MLGEPLEKFACPRGAERRSVLSTILASRRKSSRAGIGEPDVAVLVEHDIHRPVLLSGGALKLASARGLFR